MTAPSLEEAMHHYDSNADPHRLLAPISRMVFTVTGGRYGRPRIAARRWAKLRRAAMQLGAAEAAGLDQWSGRICPSTGALTAQFGITFEHALRTAFTPMRSRVRRSKFSGQWAPSKIWANRSEYS